LCEVLTRTGVMVPLDIDAFSPWEPGGVSFFIYFILAVGMVAGLLFLSGRLGERKPQPQKLIPFESGVLPTGSARLRYPVPFYLVAAFFLIFDVEAVFIFSWAIAFERLGWAAWLQMCFFILVLLVALVYIWRKGGLEWGTPHNHS
jgi:NADH-quinone oxidoreductase subunit A